MTCENCKVNKSELSAIIDGTYYRQLCQICKTNLEAGQRVSSGAADWNRTMDTQDNEAAIQQPYVQGKPNPRFIALYPDKASGLFSDEEMRNASR